MYEQFIDCYPIVSLEDGLAEDEWDAWGSLTARLGGRVQLVGDDIFVPKRATAATRYRRGSRQRRADQAEQDLTLTRRLTQSHARSQRRLPHRRSHRSGETEDATIADLAVATGAEQFNTRMHEANESRSTTSCSGSNRSWAPRRRSPDGGPYEARDRDLVEIVEDATRTRPTTRDVLGVTDRGRHVASTEFVRGGSSAAIGVAPIPWIHAASRDQGATCGDCDQRSTVDGHPRTARPRRRRTLRCECS